jgi:AraC-like DNA-binding protein
MDPYRSPEHVHGYRLATPPRRPPPVAVPRLADEVEFCAGPPAPRPVQTAGSGLLLRGVGTAPCGRWRVLRLLPDNRESGLGTMVRRIDVRESSHLRRAFGTFGASTTRTLMLSFGDPIGVALNGDRFVDRRSFLVGSHAGPLRTRHTGHHVGVQVDLEPLAAYRLTGVPGAKMADRVVDLATATSRLAGLEEDLADRDDPRERLVILEKALAAAILEGPEPDPLVAWMWDRLVQDHGRSRISDLVAETGFSHRHVSSRFREHVGLTPKTAARILRFELAVELLSRGATASQVAATCGYSDQSHLSREVASLGGSPPTIVASSNEGRWVWTH